IDVRGRGNSGGTFEPFANDARDGYDIVEWLAKQPRWNGKGGEWGGSFSGFVQWQKIKGRPAHILAVVTSGPAYPGVMCPFQYNIFAPYDMQCLSFTSGLTGNGNLFGSAAFWAAKAREYYNAHSAFKDYDRLVGNPSAVFQKWLQHPRTDAYYDAMAPSPEQYRRID